MPDFSTRCEQFGVRPLLDEFHPISESELAEIESKLSVRLSASYRDFLGRIGGVAFSNIVIRMIAKSPGGGPDKRETVDYLFGAAEERHFSLFERTRRFRLQSEEDVITIGGDLFGNLLCVNVVDVTDEQIFFWDHDDGTFYLAAESFDDLFDRLEQR